MELLLKRIARKSLYTIGHLYIDDVYFCDVIEDTDRGADSSMKFTSVGGNKGYWTTPEGKKINKVPSETAIPTGRYEITLNVQSPKYAKKATWKAFCDGYMPRLLNIHGFDGVLIHTGNTQKDSAGCLIVGQNKEVGKVVNSTVTFKNLYKKLKSTKEKIYITIK